MRGNRNNSSGRGGGRGGRGGRERNFPEAVWVKIASIFEKKDNKDQLVLSVDDFFGTLYFEPNVTSKNKKKMADYKGKLFKVNFLEVMEPSKDYDCPASLVYNISLNLANEKAAEEVDEGGGDGNSEYD